MTNVNIVLVYSPDMSQILACRRRKPPFQGLLHLVGGHIEPGEDGLHAAYRELWEETGITGEDIRLTCVIRSEYVLTGAVLEMYAGRLRRDVEVFGDENELTWVPADADFFDTSLFGGHGNIGHLILEARLHAERVFGERGGA